MPPIVPLLTKINGGVVMRAKGQGRKAEYTKAQEREVLRRHAQGQSLRAIAADMPPLTKSTVHRIVQGATA